MRRSKQIQSLIDSTNAYLKKNRITDKGNDVFVVVINNLLAQGLYEGFNFYKQDSIHLDGTDYPMDKLCTEQECQFLQIL